jgi:hypothetical protein
MARKIVAGPSLSHGLGIHDEAEGAPERGKWGAEDFQGLLAKSKRSLGSFNHSCLARNSKKVARFDNFNLFAVSGPRQISLIFSPYDGTQQHCDRCRKQLGGSGVLQ